MCHGIRCRVLYSKSSGSWFRHPRGVGMTLGAIQVSQVPGSGLPRPLPPHKTASVLSEQLVPARGDKNTFDHVFEMFEIMNLLSSLALTSLSAAPNRIGPWSMMILLASLSASPLPLPSSRNAWMVHDLRMAVIPPKQCLISSQGNPTRAMTAADVHNSLISAVTAAGSTRSFRRSTQLIGIWSSSRALKVARGNKPMPPARTASVSHCQARTR